MVTPGRLAFVARRHRLESTLPIRNEGLAICSRGHFKVARGTLSPWDPRREGRERESHCDRKIRWSVTYRVVVEGRRSGFEGIFGSKAAPLLLSVVRCQVMLGGFLVMARSVLMVFRCLLVMMRCFF
jgi:hypothetical protein